MTILTRKWRLVPAIILWWCFSQTGYGQWKEVYQESFEGVPAGTLTGTGQLTQWEAHSALGVVFDGKVKDAGRFLVARNSWKSFNQGPIFNLDLSAHPHDRVRVSFDLYTFGEWRGFQRATGGPHHRLMFFDSKATPRFAFDTSFASNASFKQAWPGSGSTLNKALTGAVRKQVDSTGRYPAAFRWPVRFEYPSDSHSLRFTMLCGAASGSGARMPEFGVDNIRIEVRSTLPTISPVDSKEEIASAGKPAPGRSSPIRFQVKTAGRTSVGVFDPATGRLVRTLLSGERLSPGRHLLRWDGLDNQGRPVPRRGYQWRQLTTPGLRARYITTIGVNPPGGENPVPSKSWVGDHAGAGIVDVDPSGIYIGSPITEGGRMILKVDSSMSRVLWSRPQFYQSGRLTRVATSGSHVFMIHPNGKLRRVNKDKGGVEAEWPIGIDGEAPADLAANGKNLVVTYSGKGVVRWLSMADGKTLGEGALDKVASVAAISDTAQGEAFVSAGADIYRVEAQSRPRKVKTLGGSITAMDYDSGRNELWAVVNGHQVVLLDAQLRISRTYSDQPRQWGVYDPKRFAGVYDVAADLEGGFFIGEPGRAPRRIARISRGGSVISEWFGGMSFYINGSFDPGDSTRLIGIAPESSVNVYKIDHEKGTWSVEACYRTGLLGDGLFPFTGSFRVVRKNDQLYLYHRVVPSVLRLDPRRGEAVPVAIAGRVLNSGRTFVQFAGTGREGYPKPWVAAAEHRGYTELKTAPKLYSWADTNGNGLFEPSEFVFYPDARHALSFHNPGDFTASGDYVGTTGINEAEAIVHLPVSGWEGPNKDAPRWDWSRAAAKGKIGANNYGYGSPRGVTANPDGSFSVPFQAGIMIHSHGQFEGGGWPEKALRGSRLLKFDSSYQQSFSVGRQSKDPRELNSSVLYYPMQTAAGPNNSVVVNDQTKQPAQVWSQDGLYVGGVLDQRADDGLEGGFYQVHGDDNQGIVLNTNEAGRTYWLMPYQGHNRLYEITGWSHWYRDQGQVACPAVKEAGASGGGGLRAIYLKSGKPVIQTTEDLIYFERFGKERHSEKLQAPYKVSWSGFIVPPLSDRYQFSSILGGGEQLAVWIDGKTVHARGVGKRIDHPVHLTGRHPHRIRVEFINPDGRANLNVLWSSRVLDIGRIPIGALYPPASSPGR